MDTSVFSTTVACDWRGLMQSIGRQGTPPRVHFIELYIDPEMQDAIAQRFGLLDGVSAAEPLFDLRRHMAVQRFLGYDYVRCSLENVDMPLRRHTAADTAALTRRQGRSFVDEHTGPITNWNEFETYPWPNPANLASRAMEWYSKNLPDDMCIIASGGFAHFAEYLSWLMGYETLCYALFDQRDLIQAIMNRVLELNRAMIRTMLQFPRVKIIWGSDDMGFRTGTLISPADLRQFVLPAHKEMAKLSHDAGRPYLLHSCGQLADIMDDLINDVRIDAKHSFEDTIEDVVATKRKYGDRIAILGGIDVDFLCRSGEGQIRRRVRQTLEACFPGGGYCLGTGNSVANYIPLENYLVMLDEGRRFTA